MVPPEGTEVADAPAVAAGLAIGTVACAGTTRVAGRGDAATAGIRLAIRQATTIRAARNRIKRQSPV